MKKAIHSARLLSIILISISTLAVAVSAEESHPRQGFWGGIDVGIGQLEQSIDGEDDSGKHLFLGFKAGYTINPHLLVGIEFSGWNLEPTDQYCIYGYCSDSSEGEGIMQVFLVTRYYPSQDSGLFLNAGGGYADHWYHSSGALKRKEGLGWALGGGFDVLFNASIALTPFAAFSAGKTGDWDYQAITLGFGVTFP